MMKHKIGIGVTNAICGWKMNARIRTANTVRKSRIEVEPSQVQQVVCKDWDEVLTVINKKEVTLDGIHGVIKVDRFRSYYTSIYHHPSVKGKETPEYQEKKAKFRDDWSTDLTESPELLCEIALALGVMYEYNGRT